MTARRGPVLTTARAAEYVGLKPQTLRRLKSEGCGPVSYKQGRLNAYYPTDLDEWLADRLRPDEKRAPAVAAAGAQNVAYSPTQEGA